MENTEREFRALLEDSQNDPDYHAQKLALDISLRISRELKTLAMTRKALAARIEVSGGRVTQMLSGDSNLTLLSLCRLALGVGLRPSIAFSSTADNSVSVSPPPFLERTVEREISAARAEEMIQARYAAVNQVLRSRITVTTESAKQPPEKDDINHSLVLEGYGSSADYAKAG